MRFGTTRTRRIAAWLLAALVLALAGYGAAAVFERMQRQRSVADYARVRAEVVSFHAAQVEDGFVLIAGDSQAELAEPDPLSCGRKIVNAGLSSTNAENYAAFFAKLRVKRRASVAVVTLGSNHLKRSNEPSGTAAADTYERDLERVVTALMTVSDRVVVAAVPPVGASLDRFTDRSGVANLTQRQKALCARLGCEQTDPYASYREADFNTAKPEATPDGLHLSDYRPAYRALDPVLCR